MARPKFYTNAKRFNVILEEELQNAAAKRAEELGLRGGFSEYVGRLIAADRKRKSRAVMNASPRIAA